MSRLSLTRKRLETLEKRQERLMPFAENKRLAEQVESVADRCRRLHAKAIDEMTKVTMEFLKCEPHLQDDISHEIDIAVSRLAGTSPTIEHNLNQQIHYFKAHGRKDLANSAFKELKNDENFIVHIGLSLKYADDDMETCNYFGAWHYYRKGKHLLSLARQIRKGY